MPMTPILDRTQQFSGSCKSKLNWENERSDQQAKHDAYASVWQTMIDALGGFGRIPKKSKKDL